MQRPARQPRQRVQLPRSSDTFRMTVAAEKLLPVVFVAADVGKVRQGLAHGQLTIAAESSDRCPAVGEVDEMAITFAAERLGRRRSQ